MGWRWGTRRDMSPAVVAGWATARAEEGGKMRLRGEPGKKGREG